MLIADARVVSSASSRIVSYSRKNDPVHEIFVPIGTESFLSFDNYTTFTNSLTLGCLRYNPEPNEVSAAQFRQAVAVVVSARLHRYGQRTTAAADNRRCRHHSRRELCALKPASTSCRARYSPLRFDGRLNASRCDRNQHRLSPNVEFQIEGVAQNYLSINTRGPSAVPLAIAPGANSTNDTGDFTLATKIKLRSETRRGPSLGFPFRRSTS